MGWADKTEVKKGNLAESIIDAYLASSGQFVPYQPVADGAHPFDRLVASRDKKRLFIADAKAKARRIYYPDTGIDVRHYEDYKRISEKHNLEVFLFFVDEYLKKIYGNYLSALESPMEVMVRGMRVKYPKKEGPIIYFPLSRMRHVANLTDEHAAALKSLSSRSYEYGTEAEAEEVLANA